MDVACTIQQIYCLRGNSEWVTICIGAGRQCGACRFQGNSVHFQGNSVQVIKCRRDKSVGSPFAR